MDRTNCIAWNKGLALLGLLALVGCSDPPPGGDTDGGNISTDLTPQDGNGDANTDAQSNPCIDAPDGSACDDKDPCTLQDSCVAGSCIGTQNDPCTSDNPCVTGTCVKGEGCTYEPVADGASCAVACYLQSSCQDGQCLVNPDTAVKCPEPDATMPCVAQLGCDPVTGQCTVQLKKAQGNTCDTDSNLCTLEICNASSDCEATGKSNLCTSEKAVTPCENWTCHPKTGECVSTGFAGEIPCSDANGCTVNDTCKEDQFGFNACKGTPLVVDDNNPCTDDNCSDGTITHKPLNNLPCASDNPCSPEGLCQEGACVPNEVCACQVDSDCEQPTNKCLGVSFCDLSGPKPVCAIEPSSVVVCPGPTKPCHTTACIPESGVCIEVPLADELPCNDGNVCTGGDNCQNGVCIAGSPVKCDDDLFCNGVESCDPEVGCQNGEAPLLDDDVSCTLDTCDEDEDVVVHTPNDVSCDDGVFCNGSELCDITDGCLNGSLILDDGVPCTEDSCDEAANQVVHTAKDPNCDNGLFCDGNEVCDALKGCQNGQAPEIDDGLSCTADSCDEDTDTVKHVPNDATCDNGQSCDGLESCDLVKGCLPDPNVTIDDGIACTIDSCDDATGIVSHIPNDAACSDGLFCNGVEVCDAVKDCIDGTPPPIDDGVPCTMDACDEGNDVVTHNPINDSCDNGLYCDGLETCDALKGCLNGPPPVIDDDLPCTTDSCDDDADQVTHTPDDGLCDNGLFCDGTEMCDAQLGCQSGPPPALSDDIECTVDTCNESSKTIEHKANHGLCSNGTFCDGVETCDANEGCQAGTPPDISDGIDCTEDSCNEATEKVIHKSNHALCDDGLYCNGPELCNAFLDCVAGVIPKLSDGIACTVDTCDEATQSSVHTPNNDACPDGEACLKGVCHIKTGCTVELADPCCGNDELEEDEECDDGNNDNGDGCDYLCNTEPPASCLDVLNENPGALSGVHVIDPDGFGALAPVNVYCDMVTDGGGWTLFMVASDTTHNPALSDAMDPNATGYFYMINNIFKQLAKEGMRVRGWSLYDPELWLECDFESAGGNYETWQANANCVQRMRLKAGGYVEIDIEGTQGNGFVYSGIYDSINPSNPLTGHSVFTKRTVGDGNWAIPSWNSTNEDSLQDPTYKDYYGEWTSSHAHRLVYAIR